MRFSGKFALRAGVLGIAATAAIAIPTTAAHAAAPTVTVTPNSGLANAQTVSVSGSGFANASTTAAIVQCSGNPATSTFADCDTTNVVTSASTDASGNLPATNYTVHTGAIGTSGGTCPATGSGNICFIAVSTDGGGADSGAAPITFAVLPSITAKPATGVKDGDKVSVSGKNFPSSKQVAVVTCSSATKASACDTNHPALGTTDSSGSFKNLKLTVATNTDGGKCKAGKTCFVIATTDIAGQGADKSQDAVTTIKLASAAAKASTKTSAKAKGSKILGTVKASGKGVKGLKVLLDEKKGGHWKKVDSSKTKKAGKFKFSKLSSGKYEVKTPKQTKGGKTYGASHSHKVHVKAGHGGSGGAPASPCANCTVA